MIWPEGVVMITIMIVIMITIMIMIAGAAMEKTPPPGED